MSMPALMMENYEAIPLEEAEGQVALEPLYQVLLFDDDDHSYQYVVKMMTELFNFSQKDAFEIAYEVDYIGQAVVMTCPLEEALVAAEKIRNFGPDPSIPKCSGSMTAAVIPAEE